MDRNRGNVRLGIDFKVLTRRVGFLDDGTVPHIDRSTQAVKSQAPSFARGWPQENCLSIREGRAVAFPAGRPLILIGWTKVVAGRCFLNSAHFLMVSV